MPYTCARWHANVPVPADSSNDEADETSDGTAGDDHCQEHKFIEVTENNNNTTLFVMNTSLSCYYNIRVLRLCAEHS